jgi:membrane-associated phospholipid phosphatase
VSAFLFPFERRVARRRLVRDAAGALIVFLVLCVLDRWLYHATAVGPDQLKRLEGKDWYRALRLAGTLWVWGPLCLAWFVSARETRGRDAAIRVFAAAALSGVLAEVLKVVIGRLRPSQTDGVHRFRAVVERFGNTHDLALPSSHAAVAFGAALMLVFLMPRAGVVALVLAIGCGWTRVVSGAHFSSDVFAAAVLGYALARLLRPGGWFGQREGLLLP